MVSIDVTEVLLPLHGVGQSPLRLPYPGFTIKNEKLFIFSDPVLKIQVNNYLLSLVQVSTTGQIKCGQGGRAI